VNAFNPVFMLAGRVLISLIFILSGIDKLTAILRLTSVRCHSGSGTLELKDTNRYCSWALQKG